MHGFPSRTSTGTATRRGDGIGPCCWCCWCSYDPFSLCALFVLYRWFWNQIFTWVGVSRMRLARCSRSGADRYFCWRNRLSNSYVWAFEKRTRRLRFLWAADWLEPPVASSPSWSSSGSSIPPSSSSIRVSSVSLLLPLWLLLCWWWNGSEDDSSPVCTLLDESAKLVGDVGHAPIGVYDSSDVTGDVLSGLACCSAPGSRTELNR